MLRWSLRNLENFHLGKPIFVLGVIALVTGLAVSTHKPLPKAELTVWVFAESHDQTYRKLIPQFEAEHNVSVNLRLLNARAVTVRLGQLFMSDLHNPELPDLVEMEINLAGRFFRPPIREIGFMPLNDYLKKTGLDQQIVKSRLATWSKEGVVFGMPHDIHPCTITYREDLFKEAGVNLPAATTWPKFQEACLKFERYWRGKGYRYRHALEMPESSSENFQAMLLQRGINPIDSYGNVNLEDARVAQTLAFYAQLVAGPRKCTTQSPQGWGAFSRDVTEGNICSFLAADWRVTYIKLYGDAISGKMRMMPLPVFDENDSPTSTIGGTMMGVTKACKKPELALKLLEFLYFSEDGIQAENETTGILPPIRSLWDDPLYHQPDPYFGGQKVGELFAQLAPKIPPRYVTAATPLVNTMLNDAVAQAVAYVDSHGADAGLEPACRAWLSDIAADLRARIKQWRLDS